MIYTRGTTKILIRKKFKEDFTKINWKNLFSNASVDSAYDSLLEEAHKLIDKHIPLEKLSKIKLKQKKKPWINNSLMRRINYKNNLYKKYQLQPDLNLKNIIFDEYKILQKSLKKEIKIAKDNYYQNFLKKTKEI